MLLLLRYLLFLLLAPHSHHLSSVGSGSQQLRKLTDLQHRRIGSAPRKVQEVCKRHEGGGGTTQSGVGSRKRVRERVDLPIQQ